MEFWGGKKGQMDRIVIIFNQAHNNTSIKTIETQ